MRSRVLVVAGSFCRAKHLERLLGRASHEVAIATNDGDALACAWENRCDVVLLDARQPGPDPFELCRSLATAPAPVLMITDEREPYQRLRAVDFGADECVSVPASNSILLGRVQSLVELKRLRDRYCLAAALGDSPDGSAVRPDRARILVCDPDLRSRERLAAALTNEFSVETVADQLRAVQCVARGLVAVALFGESGSETVAFGRQLRMAAPDRSLRLLLIANPGSSLSGVGGEAADDLILRPVDRTEATVRVRTAVRKHRLASAIASSEAALGIHAVDHPIRRSPPERFAA